MIKLISTALCLLAFSANVFAWQIIGRLPPKEHTLEEGTFAPYKSAGGALRYLPIDESTVCSSEPTLVSPSPTFTIPQGGLFKRYMSPTGVSRPWPVSFDDECLLPESPETDNPAPTQEIKFVGLHRVSINPIVGQEPSSCTFAEFEVFAKTFDSKYLFRLLRVYDATIELNGKSTCPYDTE